MNTSSGTVVEEIDYDEFGNVTNDTSPGLTLFGFAGGPYDQDLRGPNVEQTSATVGISIGLLGILVVTVTLLASTGSRLDLP